MSQNLTALFGATGKARYLQLVAAVAKTPVWRLRVYGPNGTPLIADISDYLKSFSPSFSDETKADSATFVLDNSDARFDPLASGSMSQYLKINNVLVMEKGLKDTVTGTDYLLPAFYGFVSENAPNYAPKGEQTTSVRATDAFKLAVKQKFTSYPYDNTEVNRVATDILTAFGKFDSGRIRLADVSRIYSFVQFPDVTLVDALKTLYDPLLFGVRADEAGNITTRPRLGSNLSVLSSVLGYPDQATPLSSAAVDYIIPDVPGIESVEPRSQDYEGVFNQVRVLGKSSASQQSLGPSTALFSLGDSSVAADGKINQKYDYTENATSGQNAVVAHNVYVVFNYSTNHNLDTSPRTAILSQMKWRSAWSSSTNYKKGDAVSHSGSSWACSKDASGGSEEPGTTLGTGFWDALAVAGPFDTSFHIDNEDPRQVGYVNLSSETASYLTLQIEGRQFSVGHAPTRHHGGFDFNFTIYGQPVLSYNKTLTAYADYNAQTVTGETLTDIFSDHQTYQAAHQPLAMSVPVEVFKNGVSLGKIAADQTDLSGEQKFSVDFERGRIVLRDGTYQDFTEDSNAFHPLSSGGTAQSTGSTFNLSLLDHPAPQALYQTRRDGVDITYTLPGLTVGQGYDVRLHFADPGFGSAGQRVFSVYAQGNKAIDGLDIAAKTGGPLRAYQETLTGIAPDESGVITLHICQNDPVSGTRLAEAVGPSSVISGVEVLLPQGQGAAPYAVNCGGPALSPTPPNITANYGYSPVQEAYQIQNDEVNNPLISSQAEAQSVATFHVNRSLWKRHPHRIRVGSIPHLQPGDLVRYYNPRLNADCWVYVSGISRDLQAGSGGTGGVDADTLETLLIFKQQRS